MQLAALLLSVSRAECAGFNGFGSRLPVVLC